LPGFGALGGQAVRDAGSDGRVRKRIQPI